MPQRTRCRLPARSGRGEVDGGHERADGRRPLHGVLRHGAPLLQREPLLERLRRRLHLRSGGREQSAARIDDRRRLGLPVPPARHRPGAHRPAERDPAGHRRRSQKGRHQPLGGLLERRAALHDQDLQRRRRARHHAVRGGGQGRREVRRPRLRQQLPGDHARRRVRHEREHVELQRGDQTRPPRGAVLGRRRPSLQHAARRDASGRDDPAAVRLHELPERAAPDRPAPPARPRSTTRSRCSATRRTTRTSSFATARDG